MSSALDVAGAAIQVAMWRPCTAQGAARPGPLLVLSSRRWILGRYDVSKAGSQAKWLGQSLTFTESLVVRKEQRREVDSKWIAAGDYVILLGRHDPAYMHPSSVFRVEQGGQVLNFKPSDSYPEFSAKNWEIVYKRAKQRLDASDTVAPGRPPQLGRAASRYGVSNQQPADQAPFAGRRAGALRRRYGINLSGACR